MLLNAILRILNNRCPVCFKEVGPGAVRLGTRLYCSTEHRDKRLRRGNAPKGDFDQTESSG